jgi:hypothetical protein
VFSKFSKCLPKHGFMKFCPVIPEICCGQVHGPRKERKKEKEEENNNKKRSKNNKSPNVVWET